MTLRGIPELNHVSKADPYPIPRIEDIINDIGQVSYITALDLIKGYWQVPVAKARVIGRCLWRKQGLLAGACGKGKPGKDSLCHTLGQVPVCNHALWFGQYPVHISASD